MCIKIQCIHICSLSCKYFPSNNVSVGYDYYLD